MKSWNFIFCLILFITVWGCRSDDEAVPVEIPRVTLDRSEVSLPTRGGRLK